MLHIFFAASLQELVDQPVTLSPQQRAWARLLSSLVCLGDDDGVPVAGADAQESSLGWAGQALVGVADGKWSDARDAVVKSKSENTPTKTTPTLKCSTPEKCCCCCCCCCVGVGFSSVRCECWCLASLLHLYHYDYKNAEKAAENGIHSNAPFSLEVL